jgi:uncharacterized protein YggE
MTLNRCIPLAAVAALLLALPASAQTGRDDRAPAPVIRVSGEAEVSAEPDVATFTVGAEIRDASASRAMSQVAEITDTLTAALKAKGVPQESIQTVQLTLYNTQEPEDPNAARPTYRRVYVANHTLQVEVGKDRFKQIGDLLDAAMTSGVNNVGNITFGIKDETKLRQEGLAKAVRSARAKADVMANAAAIHIVGVQTLQEGSIPRPIPMYESRTMMAADAAPSPVPPSEIKRTYNVTVEYLIQQ